MSKRKNEDTAGGPAKRSKTGTPVNLEELKAFISKRWESTVVPTLKKFIEIPNVSPLFDDNWNTNGLLEKAADLLKSWAVEQGVAGFSVEIIKTEGRTPLIFGIVDPTGDTDETVLMYGHFDKQPPLTEDWDEGLGPYTPVIKDGKLYGRGGADDGYAIFAALTSIAALQAQGVPHARIALLVEGCEESGSKDLPAYIEALKPRIGSPSLVVCLDSGCGNYEQLWVTTSLRGLAAGTLRVDVLTEGVHSGLASGIVPSSFRVVRALLDRLESADTGEVDKVFHVDIPAQRVEQAKAAADALGSLVYSEFPFVDGMGPVSRDAHHLILNRTWRPALAVTGVDGFPTLKNAGNVLRTHSSFMLSLRLPPTLDPVKANKDLKALLEKDPPYGARVTYDACKSSPGWEAPALAPWLERSLDAAGKAVAGAPACYQGEGGSIPFMKMLGDLFPKAQFLITGVLGPASNAHGPNEFIHLAYSEKVTAAVACVLADHCTAFPKSS